MGTSSQGAIDLNLFEFVGYSLGAHMIAFVSRQILSNSNNTLLIPKITGLDPAGIAYFDSLAMMILNSPLNSNDGEIHKLFKLFIDCKTSNYFQQNSFKLSTRTFCIGEQVRKLVTLISIQMEE